MNDLKKLQMVMAYSERKPELEELGKFCDELWEKLDELRSKGIFPTLPLKDRYALDKIIKVLGIE